MQVGVAGLGAMGANVAARLMEVGHQVTVWNRSADKAKPLAEATDWLERYRQFWEGGFDRLDALLEELKARERKRRPAKR